MEKSRQASVAACVLTTSPHQPKRLACAAWRRYDHACHSLPQQRQRAHLSPFCCRFHLTLPVYYRSFGAHYTSLLSMHPLCCRGYLTVYYNDRMIREAQVGYSSRQTGFIITIRRICGGRQVEGRPAPALLQSPPRPPSASLCSICRLSLLLALFEPMLTCIFSCCSRRRSGSRRCRA